MGHGAGDDRAIVTSTWELSVDALAAQGRPQSRPLLRVLSCLAPAVVIPPGLLSMAVLGRVCGNGEDGAADGLEALSSVGLITAQPGQAATRPGVTVHPLVAETNRLRLDDEDPTHAGGVAVALLTAVAADLGYDQPGDWPAWQQLAIHENAIYGYLATRLTDTDLTALARVSEKTAAAFVWAGSYVASGRRQRQTGTSPQARRTQLQIGHHRGRDRGLATRPGANGHAPYGGLKTGSGLSEPFCR
jgi:hypothetical protein